MTKIGECESCDNVDVELTLQQHGNIWMCPECLVKEETARENNKRARQIVEESRKIDSQIELKQDLFKAGTVSFIEIQAAIENNSEIPSEKKYIAVMEECALRVEKLSAAIFSEKAITLAKENQRYALTVNMQTIAAKLHESERAKFKQYDVNYRPTAPKTVKSPKTPKTSKKFNKAELYEAAKKYDVPAAQVQQIATAKNLGYEDAAKHLATLLGKL